MDPLAAGAQGISVSGAFAVALWTMKDHREPRLGEAAFRIGQRVWNGAVRGS